MPYIPFNIFLNTKNKSAYNWVTTLTTKYDKYHTTLHNFLTFNYFFEN